MPEKQFETLKLDIYKERIWIEEQIEKYEANGDIKKKLWAVGVNDGLKKVQRMILTIENGGKN